ncbi:hypothetical protein [Nocardia pseudovaccinii]|uniref:hypothetical protein n=1 Tax=Nocardia pseudovaccinii TaxID=189540 RepID=UPI0012F48F43|nr:hypothetical protein [Nocardia pseudovaccinii]
MSERKSGPQTEGPDWALRLCPICRGRGVASMIVLRGTGETDADPVIFPAHGDGGCLDRDTPARIVIDAVLAAGAHTMAEVTEDPAMAAAVLRIIRSREVEQ